MFSARVAEARCRVMMITTRRSSTSQRGRGRAHRRGHRKSWPSGAPARPCSRRQGEASCGAGRDRPGDAGAIGQPERACTLARAGFAPRPQPPDRRPEESPPGRSRRARRTAGAGVIHTDFGAGSQGRGCVYGDMVAAGRWPRRGGGKVRMEARTTHEDVDVVEFGASVAIIAGAACPHNRPAADVIRSFGNAATERLWWRQRSPKLDPRIERRKRKR